MRFDLRQYWKTQATLVQKHLFETSARNQREETEPSDLYLPQPSELFTCEFCTNVNLIFISVVF